MLLLKYTDNRFPPDGSWGKSEVGPYNAEQFVLGHVTDVHNGSLWAELISANMSLEE